MRTVVATVAAVMLLEIAVVYLHFREVNELRTLFDQCVMTLQQQ